MEKKSGEIEIEIDLFSHPIIEAQRAYRSKEWDEFKKIFADNKMYLFQDFDLLGNTAITKTVHSDDPEMLKELLGKLSEQERWRVLRKKNHAGNTLLHEIAVACKKVDMADIVLDFEKTIPLPPELVAEEEAETEKLSSEKEKKEQEEENRRPLLEWKNFKGETPVFRAAKFGNLKMLSYLVKRAEGHVKIHQDSSEETILHASVNGQYFDVALWIIKNMDESCQLAGKRNRNGLKCLQLLARMPSVFYSHYDNDPQDHFITKFIYYLLPNEGDDIEDCNSFDRLPRPPGRDLETGGQNDPRPPTTRGRLSKSNCTLWKILAKVFKWIIGPIWEEKKKNQLAEQLAKFLVRCDWSWQIPYDERNDKTKIELPPVLHNVVKRKQELQWKHEKNVKEESKEDEQVAAKRQRRDPPLLVAATNGITEIIDFYLEEHPESINHVGEDGENILHIAVKHRQKRILDLLEDQEEELPFLASRVDRENRTALHQVARMDYYRASSLPGAAFQLQEELKWYRRVEKIVPTHLHLHCDKDKLTAGDLLDIEHDKMLADAQRWIKETAQSCSTVAVLVATVVFAAAYTIPGGNNEGGSALLYRTPVFIFFTVMDIVALTFSLAAVVMFLSILSAPFELWHFHKSLPRKLNIGFFFLFLSLITTMLAFSATILITIRLPWKQWTSTLVYSAALFPITIFALIEFSLYKKIPRMLSRMFPRRWKRRKNWSIKQKGLRRRSINERRTVLGANF